MFNTYQMKPFLVSQIRRTDNPFFYSTLLFSLFLYFFSFYFVYQTVEMVKHIGSGSAVSLNAGPISGQQALQHLSYEVNFGEKEILFRPKSSSSGNKDLGFELIKIESGKKILYSSGMAQNKTQTPLVKGNITTYQKSDQIKEIYESRANGLEQSFIFENPFSADHKKDVAVIQELTTRLVPQYGPGGEILFHDSAGNYVTTYGKGTVKDSSGRTIDILPQFKEGSIQGTYKLVMTLPGSWLANAAYPVVLDPLIGNNLQLDTLTGGDYRPAVDFDGVNYMVVWMNGAAPGSGGTGASNLYGAVVAPAGTVVVPPFMIDNSKNDQMYPSVAYNAGNNNFLVVYQNYVGKSGKNEIYGKVISYSGTAVTQGSATAIAANNGDEQFPTVATDGTATTNNNYIAYLAGSSVKVIPVTTTATGTITPGTAVTLGTVTASTAPSVLPQIAFSNGTLNRYFVAWENFSLADSSGNIYGNSISKGSSSPGLSSSTPLGIAVTASTAERYPSVAFDGTHFLVTYQRGAAGAIDIYGQFVTSASASTLSGANFVVSNNSGDQTTPKVAYNSVSGAYLVAWTDSRNNAANTDIFGARVTPAGSVLDPSGVNISNIGTSSKQTPAIASGGPNAYVAWRDSATNTGNIYGQLVGPPQISGLSGSTVEARNPLTINSILYGNNGTFGADPGSANRSTAANNVTIGTYQVGSSDVTSWSLTPGVNRSIGIIAPYATAVSGGTGVGAAAVTGSGWTSGLSSNLTIQDYALAVSPPSATVLPGGNASYTVTLTTVNGFASGVALIMPTSCPSNATCSFSPNPISGNGTTSTLTVATTTSTPAGSSDLSIQGTGGSNNQLIHTASVSLTVGSAPVVTTSAATNVLVTTASLNGTVNPNGSATNAWFEWGTTTAYGSNNATAPQAIVSGTVAVTLTPLNISGLTANTLYHFRADASNASGTTNGLDLTFTTIGAPSVTTTSATSVGSTTASLNGSVNPNGSATNAWFEWGTTTAYGSNNAATPQAIGSGTTVVALTPLNISGLTLNTLYHFRADASNAAGTTNGGDLTFTTINVPTVTTNAATSIGSTTVSLNGAVNPNGSATNAWFEWGTTTAYGSSNGSTPQAMGSGTTAVSMTPFNISGLTVNTLYHFRAVASNGAGRTNGGDLTFTTLSGTSSAPTVTTNAATSIGTTTASLNGTVNPNGSATNAWFEWGLTTSYGTSNASTPQAIGSGTTTVTLTPLNISGLTLNTLYHFRADANNASGTTLGNDVTFTTLSGTSSTPTVTTNAATNVLVSSASLNGSVNPNGSATNAWFQWGTTTAYGSSNASTPQAIGSGTVAVTLTQLNISGLTANTLYHFRADASNAGGTAYGNDLTFTTINIPTVTTNAATNIGSTTASLNGSVNPNGSATNAWFDWGLTTAYGSNNAATPQAIGSGTLAVTLTPLNISGLTANTLYHFRADASNSAGTANGADLTFTTLSGTSSAPTVTTNAATSIGTTTASLNGTVNPNGSATNAWFEFGTTTAYGSSTAIQYLPAGTTSTAVSSAISGLTSGTLYHFRIGATNAAGTSYGADVTFTTP